MLVKRKWNFGVGSFALHDQYDAKELTREEVSMKLRSCKTAVLKPVGFNTSFIINSYRCKQNCFSNCNMAVM